MGAGQRDFPTSSQSRLLICPSNSRFVALFCHSAAQGVALVQRLRLVELHSAETGQRQLGDLQAATQHADFYIAAGAVRVELATAPGVTGRPEVAAGRSLGAANPIVPSTAEYLKPLSARMAAQLAMARA